MSRQTVPRLLCPESHVYIFVSIQLCLDWGDLMGLTKWSCVDCHVYAEVTRQG